MRKKQPKLENCFNCANKVFEFEDGIWACDTCKTVWTFKRKTWVNITLKPQPHGLLKLKMKYEN